MLLVVRLFNTFRHFGISRFSLAFVKGTQFYIYFFFNQLTTTKISGRANFPLMYDLIEKRKDKTL